jgi:hypothetical protein
MTVEAAFERSMHAPADIAAKRRPGLIELVLWTAGFVCVGFTTCYAYHIGL